MLERVFALAPRLQVAYQLPEDLMQVFEQAPSKAHAHTQIPNWIQRVRESGETCFDDFLGLLETWLDEITNYFEQHWTSGFVEGFNNKIKVLKRRCYGITNLAHFFQRIYLDIEGYRLFA